MGLLLGTVSLCDCSPWSCNSQQTWLRLDQVDVVVQPLFPHCFSILHNDNIFHINTEWFCKQQIDFRHLLQSPDLNIISEALSKFKSWECAVPLEIWRFMHHEALVSVKARSVCSSEVLCCSTVSRPQWRRNGTISETRGGRQMLELWNIAWHFLVCLFFLCVFSFSLTLH